MNTEHLSKWIVLVAAYSGIIILCSTMFMGGIIYIAILDRYPQNVAKASLILSLNSALLGILGPGVTSVTDRISCRFAMVSGGMLLAISGFLSAFAPSLDVLLVTYGILGGIGNAMVGVPFSVVLGLYFDKRRDFVIALSMSMVAVGMLIAAPLVTFLLETYALRGTFFIIAGLNAQLCIIGTICKPSRLELYILSERKKLENCTENVHSVNTRGFHHIVVQVMRLASQKLKNGLVTDLTFLFFLQSICALNALFAAVSLHIPNYAAVKGSSNVQISIITTCFNAGNTAGRFLAAAMIATDKIDKLWSHTMQVGLIGIITLAFPYYDVFFLAKYVFAVLVGLFTGGPATLMTPISLELVGVENIASAHGLEYLFSGCGQLVGAPIAAAIYGYTGSYTNSFIYAGCTAMTGSLLALITKCRFITQRKLGIVENAEVTVENEKSLLATEEGKGQSGSGEI